ncbi:hypothetical protein VTL71DRAFT_11718 [Oculimacula yallundae]|uniref:Uncharacterized protein n=1 Tax=Oculimacula yallundae TaxID=86028 RepID=A0ABR4CQZ8_9HELO
MCVRRSCELEVKECNASRACEVCARKSEWGYIPRSLLLVTICRPVVASMCDIAFPMHACMQEPLMDRISSTMYVCSKEGTGISESNATPFHQSSPSTPRANTSWY